MRYALISDIHANLPALEAVLADIDARPEIAATYHLGDLVGYAPWPDEVVGLLRSRGIAGVAGNYDSTVATDYRHCGCRYEDPRQEELSHLSYDWTRRAVSAETRRILGALPFRLDVRPGGGHQVGPTFVLLHGNNVLNTVYTTADRSDDVLRRIGAGVGARPGDLVGIGHTHLPWHRVVDAVHYLNTGSVGRPKDGDPRAGYAMIDWDGEIRSVEIVRVRYDVERAARAVLESSLPDEFADQLRAGGSVSRPADAAPGR